MFVPMQWAGATAIVLVGVVWQLYRRRQIGSLRQVAASIGCSLALIALLAVGNHGAGSVLWVSAAFAVTAVPLAFLDWRSGYLPNRLLAQSYLLIIAAMLATSLLGQTEGAALARMLGSAGLLFLFYAVLYVYPGGLGGGDVKFVGACGAVLGWHSWPSAFVGLLLIWLCHALFLLLRRVVGYTDSAEIPHGPFLVLGTVGAVFLSG